MGEETDKREYTMRRVSLSLTATEAELVNTARGVSRPATYCHDGAMWLIGICERYLAGGGPADNLAALLDTLLLRLRPDRTRHHRQHFGRIIVVFSTAEHHRLDAVRGAKEKTTFVYVGVLAHARFILSAAGQPPALERLVHLITAAGSSPQLADE